MAEMQKPQFECHSVWAASYLAMKGIPYLGTRRSTRGRTVFLFDNAGDRAWQLSLAWYQGDECLVDGPRFVDMYIEMMRHRDSAETGSTGSQQDNGKQGTKAA